MWLNQEDKRAIAIGSTIIIAIILVMSIMVIAVGSNLPKRLLGYCYITENNYWLDMIVVIDTKTDKRACYRKFSGTKDYQLVTCPTDEKPNDSIPLPK